MWIKFKNGATIGQKGSENGTIVNDVEYCSSCRITLERCKKYYAITCGVYGSMVHTAFYDEDSYDKMYTDMKQDLQSFVDSDTTEDEDLEFYDKFVSKY
jgi:hypothetical protein